MSKRLEAIKKTHAVCSDMFPQAKDIWDDFQYLIGRMEQLEAAGSKLGLQCVNIGNYGPLKIRPGNCTCSTCNFRKALEES